MNTQSAESLFQSSLEQLEFARILEHVAGYAASSLGRTFLEEATPIDDVESLRRDLGMVTEARNLLVEGEPIPINGIYDINRGLALSTVAGNWLDGEDIRAMYRTMQGMRSARDFVASKAESSPLLHDLTKGVYTNRILEKHISDAVDENGTVKDNASRLLFDLRRDIVSKSGALRERLGKILRRVSDDDLVTGEYVTLSEGRLVLPVRVEYKRRLPGIIHGESKTGSTVFLEPAEIFDLNNEIAELTFAERREVERILEVITAEIGAEADGLKEGLWKISLLDSIVARAKYAEEYSCIEPTISDEGEIHLAEARHPILGLRLENVVPMSIELGTETRCVIISGPNAGGKTVAVKTLGLVTMMALCGIHPPAGICTVSPSRVYTDIGDRQSVENDLSTFSAHMTRVRDIVHAVNHGDIVLLDELGTGTDPDEGAAIAAAILEKLLALGAIVLATTHHSALKLFAYEQEGVENAGMEFDTNSLQPTYRLLVGSPGNSYAFELLDRFGFDAETILTARENLGEERGAMTAVIEELEKKLGATRSLEVDLLKRLQEAEEAREDAQREMERTKEKRSTIVEETRAAAAQILEKANGMVENTLREIRSGASNEAVQAMRKEIEEARVAASETYGAKKEGVEQSDALPLSIGTSVRLVDGHEIGEVETEPDEEGNVVVQFGPLRMRANRSELTVVAGKEKRAARRSSARATTNAEELRTSVDIRGKYADEAMVDVEGAISSALGSGLSRLEIIHGKGTGALRRATHDHLKSHPHVTSFRIGTINEGGAGVTIVEFV